MTLRRPGQVVEATTGPNGFASFRDVEIGEYRLSITPPSNGWRLSRSGADSDFSNPKKLFVAGGAYNITPASFQPRVNGDDEAWVRFSVIRVNRITTGGASEGDVITFVRKSPERLIETVTANRGGWASVVAGGFFYEETYVVTNTNTGQSFEVTIPYGYQPKINWAAGTCKDCTYP